MSTETISFQIDAELAERLRAMGEDPAALAQRLICARFGCADNDGRSWALANKAAIDAYSSEIEERRTLSERLNNWR
jgi:hypothetical protein